MLKSKTYYEIIEADTNEILVDGLSFTDMAEQFEIYQDFYGQNAVIACARNETTKKERISFERAYKDEFINYFAELQEMGNLN